MAFDSTQPYLSVVVATRNDDHGGDPLKRLQAFVDCFDEQCRRTGLDAEVIVVEWNPLVDRPPVSSLLRLPVPASCVYRFLDVPPELHQQLRFADVLPMFQMIAKNVGIRRARGRFVLATNIDIILSTEMVEQIAARRLDRMCLYRADRHDVEADLPVDGSLDERLRYCSSHHLRVHTRWGSFPVDPGGRHAGFPEDIVDGRAVRLGAGWHVREAGGEGRWFRWAREKSELILDPSAAAISMPAVLEIDLESNPHHDGSWVDLVALEDQRLLARTRIEGACRLELTLDAGQPDGERRIELQVAARDGGSRREGPIFERRGGLEYRVSSARLRAAPPPIAACEYPLRGWNNANQGSGVTVSAARDGLAVTTDSRSWSYCVRYGPLVAAASGGCRFELAGTILQGDVSIGVLSSAGRFWIPSTVRVLRNVASRWFTVDVDVYAGHPFWLVLSNNHPQGDGVSSFVIHRLDGPASVRLGDAVRMEVGAGILSRPLAERAAVAYAKAAPAARSLRRKLSDALRWRTIRSAVSDLFFACVTRALSDSTRQRLVRESPDYQQLKRSLDHGREQIRELDPLRNLTDLKKFLLDVRPDDLHVNACGDFQLMAREHWERLLGYPEFETFSMNLDAVLSYMAEAAGVREYVLDPPIYHLEHEIGSGWSPEGEALLQRRIAERGITWLDAQTVHIWATYMRWLGRPMVFNGPDWGMAGQSFAEKTVVPVSVEQGLGIGD